MEQQNNNKPNFPQNLFIVLLSAVIITALISGIIVFVWLTAKSKTANNQLANKIAFLENKISESENQINNLKEQIIVLTEQKNNPWHKFTSDKYGISFIFPQKINSSSDGDVLYFDDRIDNKYDISLRYLPSDNPDDFNISDNIKNSIINTGSCKQLESGGFLPVNFRRTHLCDIVNMDNSNIILYAIGLDPIYQTKLNGLILVLREDNSILLEGRGFIAKENRTYVSMKIQEMSDNEKNVDLDVISRYPATEQELSDLISSKQVEENFKLLEKITKTIEL